MVGTAAARDRLSRKLEPLLGAEDADFLMDHLPPGGWSEVATKTDILELRAELAELRAEMVTRSELPALLDLHVDARMAAIARQWTMANVAMSATMLAAVIAAVRL